MKRGFYKAVSGSGSWKGIFRMGMQHTCPEAVVHFYSLNGEYIRSEQNGHTI
jgi:hypothetical protein